MLVVKRFATCCDTSGPAPQHKPDGRWRMKGVGRGAEIVLSNCRWKNRRTDGRFQLCWPSKVGLLLCGKSVNHIDQKVGKQRTKNSLPYRFLLLLSGDKKEAK